MAAFAPDALHNNISREFIDAEAIRAFGAKEIFGDCVTMAVHRAWIATVVGPTTLSLRRKRQFAREKSRSRATCAQAAKS